MTTHFEVVDPISSDEAAAPAEQEKKFQFGEELAQAIADVTCEEHARVVAKAWHVGVEMRLPIAVRDRFVVTVDADGKRFRDIGPMSADSVNHCLSFIESGLAAGLPGCEAGSLSRKITVVSFD
jgi:hypothetical protein